MRRFKGGDSYSSIELRQEDQRENGKLMMGGTGLLCSEEIREEEEERKPVAGASKRDF